MQRQHWLMTQLASTALIGLSRIGEAVAQHDLTFSERGLDHFTNVLRPRSEHQGQLCQWSQRRGTAIKQKLANLISGRCAARFPSRHHRQVLSTQDRSQPFELGTFAASVETFESNESAAMRVRW